MKIDHQSLKHLLDQSLQTSEQQAWLHKFLGYHFHIEYEAGKDNVAADSLSCSFYIAWSQPHSQLLDDIK